MWLLRGGVDDGEGDGDGAGAGGDGDGAGDGDDGVPVVVVMMARMCSRFAVLEGEDSGRGLGRCEE